MNKLILLTNLLFIDAGQFMADGDGGEGGISQADVDAAVAKAVSDATTKLTGKNDELKGELGKAKDILKKFEGLDADDVRSTMDLFNQSEEAKLLKEGKFDEVISKRTEKLRGDYDGKMADLQKERDAATEAGSKFEQLYKNKIVDDEIRKIALEAKVIPEALEDVLRRGRDVFQLAADGTIEARDKDGNLLKSGDHLMDPKLFVEGLKKSAPYYWPGSTGTGAAGGSGGGAGNDVDAQLADAAAKGDTKKYRELRRKQITGVK